MLHPTPERKNLDIECLRAAAVLMTLFQHAEVLSPHRQGWYWSVRQYLDFWGGVDLFFCISGFIITRQLIRTHPPSADEPGYLISRRLGWRDTAIAFWTRRAWRLWPAAWLWIVLSVMCAALLNQSGIFGSPTRMMRDGLAAFLHLANLHWAGCYMQGLKTCNMVPASQIFTDLPTGWSLAVYWSLSLEEQFYFLVPMVLFMLPKRWLALGIGACLVALAPMVRDPLGLAWFVRVDPILVGVALGWATQVRGAALAPPWLARPALARSLAAAMLLFIAWMGAPARSSLPGAVTAIALCSGALVWIAAADRQLLIPATPWLRAFFVWAGSRSYALYLVHMVAYFLAIELWFRGGGAQGGWRVAAYFLTALALTGVFAEGTVRAVEAPLRVIGQRRAQARLARASAR